VSLNISKPWSMIGPETIMNLPTSLGVFELADETGTTLVLGYAGALSTFGLRSEIPNAARETPSAACFRFEETSNYISRIQELHLAQRQDAKR
jgi:hypothetical protein